MPFYSTPKGNSPVLAGAGAPDPELGNVGDIYFDTTYKSLYGPKSNAGWGTGTSLQGATTTDASLLTTGTLSDARLSQNVVLLDGSGKVPASSLPSFVDDVLEFATLAAFPATGETGKIYIAIDTKSVYRWSGSAYIAIISSPVTSVAGKTGAVTLTKSDVGLGNVDNTADASKPVSAAVQTALDGKADTAHAHGNLTSDGKIGSSSGLPVITGADGILQTGYFGSLPGMFCQGNDLRLSDSRTPIGLAGGDLDGLYPNPTLAPTGVVAGQYTSVTVDAKGRVTEGTFPTTLAGYGITDAAASSHSHGNITSDGKIGWEADRIVVTGTSGEVTTATIGNGLQLSGGSLTATGGGGGGDASLAALFGSLYSGEYDNSADYNPGDIVLYSGSLWTRVLPANPGYPPGTAYWEAYEPVLSVAGKTGDVAIYWNDINSVPPEFAPVPHATQHGINGSDPISPSAIGACAEDDVRLENNVRSLTSGIPDALAITNCVSMSQAAYDALATKDPTTLYVIT